NMWSRYLGQSMGAAIAGALFNSAMISQLRDAPSDVAGALPDVSSVVRVLQSDTLAPAGADYLRLAFEPATHHVYSGMVWGAVLALVLVLMVPRRPSSMLE